MATPIPPNRACFTLAEVARATRGTVTRRASSSSIGITTDSRAVAPGSIFVALRGELHDGHTFASAAVARGAHILVLQRNHALELPEGTSVVEVDDTLVAWGDLAGAHLEKWRMASSLGRVVAITGSAGKTTTKELTAALLSEVAPTHFTAGNLNNRIGVPAVIFALESRDRFCVLEMGMSLPGELDAIASFAKPDVSVIVNVGVAHSEGVGGREGVMHEKGAVYRALGPAGIAIVNADDDYVGRAAKLSGVQQIKTFGRSHDRAGVGGDAASGVVPDYGLVSRATENTGSRVLISAAGRALSLFLPLAGEAAAIDLTAAIAAQEAASFEPLSTAVIERAIAAVRPAGRGEVRLLDGDILLVDDTYNANPASMQRALETLAELGKGRRKVVVLGEMKELGALASRQHEALGDAVADAGVVLAIGCGGLIDLALDRARSRGVHVISASSTEAAAAEAVRHVMTGDAVLVKGSRSVAAERVVSALAAIAR